MQIESINRDPGVAVSGRRSAIAEMKEILSLRLPYFYRCALRLLGNAADAEDAVQEALLAAYRHIGQFSGQSQMTTWLTTIVRRCALMHYANGGARPICRWMIRSKRCNRTLDGKDSPTVGPAQKTSVEIPSWPHVCANTQHCCPPRCEEHLSCVW